MNTDTTKIDRFALKGEIRVRQAACHAINVEYHKTLKKLATLHKKLVTEYKGVGGSRRGCDKFLDEHPTYQSIKREAETLRVAKAERRIPWELILAHCYLKGNTYEGSGTGYAWNAWSIKSITKWIPGATEETELCVKQWLSKWDVTRSEIESFGVEAERLKEAQASLTQWEKTIEDRRKNLHQQQRELLSSQSSLLMYQRQVEQDTLKLTRAEDSFHDAMVALDSYKEKVEAAKKALEDKKSVIFETQQTAVAC